MKEFYLKLWLTCLSSSVSGREIRLRECQRIVIISFLSTVHSSDIQLTILKDKKLSIGFHFKHEKILEVRKIKHFGHFEVRLEGCYNFDTGYDIWRSCFMWRCPMSKSSFCYQSVEVWTFYLIDILWLGAELCTVLFRNSSLLWEVSWSDNVWSETRNVLQQHSGPSLWAMSSPGPPPPFSPFLTILSSQNLKRTGLSASSCWERLLFPGWQVRLSQM